MQYLLTPQSKKVEPFVWWDGAFTDEELDYLQTLASSANAAGMVGGSTDINEVSKIRRSKVSWLNSTADNEWVFKRLGDIVGQLNSSHYAFDITGFGEPLQLTNYDHSDHGTYGWHQDYNGAISRKLSMVLQLTDPSQYEGGNLQVMTNANPITIRKQRGLVAVFPAYALHQVTPVTQGSRQSLVAWVSGPAFK